MLIGNVCGTMVSTQKEEGLSGFKLLVIRIIDIEAKPTSSYVVAADAIGAGLNDLVIVVQGSSARLTSRTKNKPVDSAIVAIIDTMEVEGEVVYNKQEAAAST